MGNPKGVERDFEQLERRRLKAAKLFDRGYHQGEVARRMAFTASRFAVGIKPGRNKEPKHWLRRRGRAVSLACNQFN